MKTEQQLDEAIARLNPDIAPPTDLWPAIAQQLAAARSRQLSIRRWLASAAALLIGFTVWQQWPVGVQSRQFSSDLLAEQAQFEITAPLTTVEILQSRRQMLLAQQLQLEHLQQIPAGFGNWRQQLDIWRQASEQVTLALMLDPNNAILIKKLTKMQQQQLDYIDKLVSASQLS